MTSTMEWIRQQYDVPARHKMRVTYRGNPATITGTHGTSLVIRVDGDRRKHYEHPCYAIVYPEVPKSARPRGWCKHCGKDRAMTKSGVMGAHLWRYRGGAEPCPGGGVPPWKPVRNQTHPGDWRATS